MAEVKKRVFTVYYFDEDSRQIKCRLKFTTKPVTQKEAHKMAAKEAAKAKNAIYSLD